MSRTMLAWIELGAAIGMAVLFSVGAVLLDSLPKRIGFVALAAAALAAGLTAYLGLRGTSILVSRLLLIAMIGCILIAAMAIAVGTYPGFRTPLAPSTFPGLASLTTQSVMVVLLVISAALNAVSLGLPLGTQAIVLGVSSACVVIPALLIVIGGGRRPPRS